MSGGGPVDTSGAGEQRLELSGGVAGQDRSCSRLGIDRAGLAAASLVATVRLVDLSHVLTLGAVGDARSGNRCAFRPTSPASRAPVGLCHRWPAPPRGHVDQRPRRGDEDLPPPIRSFVCPRTRAQRRRIGITPGNARSEVSRGRSFPGTRPGDRRQRTPARCPVYRTSRPRREHRCAGASGLWARP